MNKTLDHKALERLQSKLEEITDHQDYVYVSSDGNIVLDGSYTPAVLARLAAAVEEAFE